MSAALGRTQGHILFWSFILLLLFGFLWLFKSVLLPFVLGIAVAYLLNPMVGLLGRVRIARGPAALMILSGFLVFVLAFLAIFVPVIVRQLAELAQDIPVMVEKLLAAAQPATQWVEQRLGETNGADIRQMIRSQAGSAVNVARYVLENVAAGGQAVFGFVSVLVFMPIVAYFMMKEWPQVTGWAQGLIPPDYRDTVLDILKKIDEKIAGFVRGQITVAFTLGVLYALALSLAGLKYGFFIGLASGALSIIPMLGSVTGLLISVTVAWFQSGEWSFVLLIAALFLGGQFLEGNFLTPRLVGDSVGLHPLWVFFALLAGGSLLGITGMLLAVPVTAAAGVLIGFAIGKYKDSTYFRGKGSHAKSGKTKTGAADPA